MKFPQPQYIANLIVEKGNNLEFDKLENVAFQICRIKFPTPSDEEIWDYLDIRCIEDLANELFIKKTDNFNDGISINFIIEDDNENYYIKFLDKPEIHLLRLLQKDTSDNFEFFCKKILDGLGGNTIVSGGPSDGGIDFYSTNISINKLSAPSTIGSRILVIGQAKRYIDGNHVKLKELREFVGASLNFGFELKRSRSEQLGVLQPTVIAFWTTSDFHSDAKKYAKDMGIWYLNGIALCQLALQLEIEL
ncbi:restriction endonuclease [Flavobacterium sp. RHBU_24]|uniref:restriction endonuclease n=1 Tax=Flavobacterium sp. RHBU_24 TaxID=3391185 RepID=UPI0039850B23